MSEVLKIRSYVVGAVSNKMLEVPASNCPNRTAFWSFKMNFSAKFDLSIA